MNNLRRIFNPTKEEQEEDRQKYKKLHYELAKKKVAQHVNIVFML